MNSPLLEVSDEADKLTAAYSPMLVWKVSFAVRPTWRAAIEEEERVWAESIDGDPSFI